ncbi:MAG: T9SS type A sorting domain-containing protein [Bacteroidota bacterium]|nr:T9SS type A sorting domain-containing protein [Bacteroidota bacterium]
MKNKLLSLVCTIAIIQFANAQTQNHPTLGTIPNPYHTTIQEIQTVAGSRLSVCDDRSYFHTLTVVVRGRMNVPGRITFDPMSVNGINYPSVTTTTSVNQYGRELTMQAGNGPYSGIWIRPSPPSVAQCNQVLTPNDILDAAAGDSVQVMGIVDDTSGLGFGGQTQIIPLNFTILGTASNLPPTLNGQQVEGVYPITVPVSQLNTGSDNINNLPEGEQYEGMFVELRDLFVEEYSRGTTVQTTIDFNENVRYRIVCKDAAGNRVQIYDRFKAGRLPNDVTTSSTCGGQQVSAGGRLSQVPIVGGKYDYVRGILVHIKNQVPGQSCKTIATISGGGPSFDKGYQLEPFHPSHYKIAQYNPPIITEVFVSPQSPKIAESATISATIQAIDPGISIASATLFFSADTLNYASWNSIPMTSQGNTWSGTISNNLGGFAEGKTIYFYIKASDSRSPAAVSVYPRVPVTISGTLGKEKPLAFVIRANGLQITDVQKTPFTNGRSLYENRIVTITGVVTSTPNDLGIVTLQDENVSEWGGIFLDNNIYLQNVNKGDKITVVGKVVEQASGGSSTITMLKGLTLSANIVPIAKNVAVTPIFIDHTLLSGNYEFRKHEKYEAIYAQISATSGKLYVVDTNADYKANFSEYRIGTDKDAILSFPETITSSLRNVAVVGTRVLAGRAPVYNSNSTTSTYVISSQVFPLVNTPTALLTSSGSNFLPDTSAMKSKYINPIYANRKVTFDNISGIITHSFGNMKLLPRDIFDISGLQVNGVPAVLTLPGFKITSYEHPILNNNDLIVYPNPANNTIHLKLNTDQSVKIELFNIVGDKVLSEANIVRYKQLDLSTLTKGIYILKAGYGSNGNQVVKRIVLQ